MATPPDFTAGQILTAAQMNLSGLWKISTSTTNSSGVVNFFNTLSSDYRNYKIILTTTTSAQNLDVKLRVTTNTTPFTSALYNSTGYRINYTAGTTVSGANNFAEDSFFVGRTDASVNFATVIIELNNPAEAAITTFVSEFIDANFAGQKLGYLNNTTAYDGFQLALPASWAGSVTLYGYRD
jgi:hypothetical protein